MYGNVIYENNKIKKIIFRQERTKLAKDGLFRTGWVDFNFKNINIQISRYALKGKSYYTIMAISNKSYDNVSVKTMKEVLKIVNSIDKYSLTNEAV